MVEGFPKFMGHGDWHSCHKTYDWGSEDTGQLSLQKAVYISLGLLGTSKLHPWLFLQQQICSLLSNFHITVSSS